MKTIWKTDLEVVGLQTLSLPVGAEILSVQAQYDMPRIWYECNPAVRKENRTFHTFGTGASVPENKHLDYLGTYQVHDGDMVFHVYEER